MPVSGVDSDIAHMPSRLRLIVISGFSDAADIEPLERSISAQLADLTVDVIFRYSKELGLAADGPDRVALPLMRAYDATVAFVIHTTGSRVDLRILRATSKGISATDRPVLVKEGSPRHEALAVIVRATAMAILDQRSATVEPKREPKKPSPPLPPASTSESDGDAADAEPPSRQYMFGDMGGAIGIYSDGASPWGGMMVGIGGYPLRQLYLRIGYVAFSKIKKRAFDIDLVLERHPIHLGIGYFGTFKRLYFGGEISVVLDYVSERISSEDPRYDTETGSGELHVALLGNLQVGVRIRDPFVLYLSAGAEVHVLSRAYGIDAISGEKIVLRPLPVLPVFGMGLRFNFF